MHHTPITPKTKSEAQPLLPPAHSWLLPALQAAFRYEPETGHIYHKDDLSTLAAIVSERTYRAIKFKSGQRAFDTSTAAGYYVGSFAGQYLRAARVAYALHNGEWPEVVDHINGATSDDRAVNLRSVSTAENARNCQRSQRNTTGVAGVAYNKRAGKFVAHIQSDNVRTFLGYFDTLEAAAKRRKEAEEALGFHHNHGRDGARSATTFLCRGCDTPALAPLDYCTSCEDIMPAYAWEDGAAPVYAAERSQFACDVRAKGVWL